MEGITACRQQVAELHSRARAQLYALRVLEKAFAQEAECLRRCDQVRCLDDLQARVARKVADMQQMEAVASCGFTKAMLISGVVKFAFGSLMGVALRTQEHPLSVGSKLAANDFELTSSFGTVLVAIGARGVPDEVEVIPLSQCARQLDGAESEIVAAIEARGYRLLTPESFFRALDELKEKVLKGVLTLPVGTGSFLLKPADGVSE